MRNLLKPLLAVKTKKGYSVFTAVVVTLFSAWVLFDATKTEVVLATDGEVETVKTHVKTVGELLEQTGINVGKFDYLSHVEQEKLQAGMEIQYKKAVEIVVTIDGEAETYHTTANTVGEFFNTENLTFTEHDDISHDQSSLISEGLEIAVQRAYEVKVIDALEEAKYWTTGGTVKQFLIDHNIELNKLDKIEPTLEDEVTEDTVISIIRVVKEEKEVEEAIAFKTEEKQDASLEKGKTKVVQEGKEGKVLKTYEITYENGEEVAREVLNEKELAQPQNKIVAVGTKVVQKQAARSTASKSSAAPSGNGKVFVMEATAYGPDCRGCSGITATGINIKKNPNAKIISVDPRVIPLGSRVWVEGYGEAIAGDTGGAIKGNRIDVLMPSESVARNKWGRRTVQVKILN